MDIKDFARLLFRAIRCSDTELIGEILKHKESKKLMNFKDDLGRTPIEYAVVLRDITVIQVLFQVWPMLYSRALLKAVDVGSIEVVKYLLENEQNKTTTVAQITLEIIKSEQAYSQMKMTPLLLAAQKNYYEILSILLENGCNTIPRTHRVGCGCKVCKTKTEEDSLRLSRFRLDVNKARCSPAMLILTEKDPIQAAFKLSHEFDELSMIEIEFREEYLELVKIVDKFTFDLISHARSSHEMEALLKLNHTNRYSRLELFKKALKYKQVKFLSQANCQQVINRVWYGELSYLICQSGLIRTACWFVLGLLWPLWSIAYLVAPNSEAGKMLNIPILQFVCSLASYITFLLFISLTPFYHTRETAGPPFNCLDWLIILWIIGQLWHDAKNIYYHGLKQYIARQGSLLYITFFGSFTFSYVMKAYAFYHYGSDTTPVKECSIVALKWFIYSKANIPLTEIPGVATTKHVTSLMLALYHMMVVVVVSKLVISAIQSTLTNVQEEQDQSWKVSRIQVFK
ncbi:Oidioi.mRNA.OKI2018_I69.chr1.g3377.t1.cds [Oikopleura dioica]|uniref:Oidioi.mRNA.OKI2018_I69.chr1.g3377.t1.cds n=1 Tax=Oikopleura dioica TaxID=34765 RepID=A0ABN7STR0_OIKDI|nr:Oidioi.mRNA.OKI2018_I69.chr1.g3377.t1.cds [Oikopleura dioica]